jgi:transposase-like protein
MRQLLLPMVLGMSATKRSFQELCIELGVASMQALFGAHAEQVAGPKHKRNAERTMYHWGSTDTEFPFAGRKLRVPRPRVRTRDGHEVALPFIEELRASDPLPEYVVEQILLGVSTRGYDGSLDPTPASLSVRGTSKSAASRHIVSETTRRMKDFTTQSLAELDVVVLMLDGVEVAKHSVIVALGIDVHGKKHPLGLWVGSTENKAVCTSLLQDLLARGLRIEGELLCVIDGAKGLRSAIEDVFGTAALVQRCQNHKKRNVRDHLPEHRRAYALRMMNQAYHARSFQTAKKQLLALVSWLEENGEDDAAASLREGLLETLTVLKLDLSAALTRSLSTTNAIENLMGTVRTVTRNVKRWRNSNAMVKRWVSLSLSTAQRKFRAIRGYKNMTSLVNSLRRKVQVDNSPLAA